MQLIIIRHGETLWNKEGRVQGISDVELSTVGIEQARLAALCAAVCAVLTLFGIIHSVMPTGELYLPWLIKSHAHYMTAVAYLALSGILLLLTGKVEKPAR